jgi:hypothetical protein
MKHGELQSDGISAVLAICLVSLAMMTSVVDNRSLINLLIRS